MDDKLTKIIEYYDDNAQAYSSSKDERMPIPELEQFIKYLSKDSLILDAGCGYGRDSKYLAARNFKTIGIDLSQKLLDNAKLNSPSTDFHQMDIRNIDFPDQYFDGIWCNAVLLHLPVEDVKKALSEFHRVLKDVGILHILVKKGTGELVEDGEKGKTRYFTYFQENQIKDLLNSKNFKIIDLHTFNEKERFGTQYRELDLICCLAQKIT